MKNLSKLYLSLALLLGSCATTYQEEGFFTNGHSTKPTALNSYIITYHANEMTDPDEVLAFALRRCTEVAKQNGYRYFIVTEDINHLSKKKIPGLHYPSVQLEITCFYTEPDSPNVWKV